MVAPSFIENWAHPEGIWEPRPDHCLAYKGSTDTEFPHGISITDVQVQSGFIRGFISMSDARNSAAAFVFGYSAAERSYYSAGLGGYHGAYDIQRFIPTGKTWLGLEVLGEKKSLQSDKVYDLKLEITGGQRVQLFVNQVEVIRREFWVPITGQLGLYAWGNEEILFDTVHVVPATPKVFVIISFNKEYDKFFDEAIKPLKKSHDVKVYRVKDVKKSGQIYDDIIKGIIEADVVVAEVTPCNENIFYELGYSHALNKPTILLKQRKRTLPFDVYYDRCIEYDESDTVESIQGQLWEYVWNTLHPEGAD